MIGFIEMFIPLKNRINGINWCLRSVRRSMAVDSGDPLKVLMVSNRSAQTSVRRFRRFLRFWRNISSLSQSLHLFSPLLSSQFTQTSDQLRALFSDSALRVRYYVLSSRQPFISRHYSVFSTLLRPIVSARALIDTNVSDTRRPKQKAANGCH